MATPIGRIVIDAANRIEELTSTSGGHGVKSARLISDPTTKILVVLTTTYGGMAVMGEGANHGS